ncbi:MAG: UDP-N-acetylmuramoyl-tripeptide--D-alanyl-D-alanine ligase [Clostridia bacterium]|nr:UDP-N-acetylmuramoyl-tripeptide--D-alanyl-D-alanine ligase [Clostridia bacterium]
MLTLSEIAKALHQSVNAADFPIEAVQTDSRQVKEHTLFAALVGERVDAHRFIPALDAQFEEIVFLVSRLPEEPTRNPCFLVEDVREALGLLAKSHLQAVPAEIVCVTGSVGKTTTKNFILSALAPAMQVSGTLGNMNNELGVPLTALAVSDTDRAAVIEMGMRGLGQIHYLTQFVTPDIAVITNIGVAHLELLKSRENIACAKLELVDALPRDGLALLNGDEPLLCGARPNKNCLYFGLKAHNDYRAEEIEGSSFTVCYPGGRLRMALQVEGEHQIMNALAAFGVGHRLGVEPALLKQGIEVFAGDGRRMFTETVGGVTVIDDSYNAAPDSMAASLKVLAGKGGRRVAVLGDMLELGAYEEKGHRDVGLLCGELGIDAVVCIGERAKMIYDALPAETEKYYFGDRATVQLPKNLVRSGDSVLFKASNAMNFTALAQVLKERIGE